MFAVAVLGVSMVPLESSGQTPSAREQQQRRLYEQQQHQHLREQQQQEREQRRQQDLQRRQQEQQVRGQQTLPVRPAPQGTPPQGTPAYVNEMPTVADVLKRTSGSDPVDTAARQFGAFNQLNGVIRFLRRGGEFGRDPISPQENALGQSYSAAQQEAERRGQSLVAKTATATSGPESAGPKWFLTKAKYDNEAFREELLRGSWPRLWAIYKPDNDANKRRVAAYVQQRDAQKEEGEGFPEAPVGPSNLPRRSVMNLRLGMSLKQVLAVFATNKPAFEVAPYEPQETRDLPGTRYVPTLTAKLRMADGGSDSFELEFSPPPLPSQLVRIFRWRNYSIKEEGMAVLFGRALDDKYGPSQHLAIHGGVDAWAWNRGGVPVGPSAELAKWMGKNPGMDVDPAWYQRAWSAGISQIIYLRRFSAQGGSGFQPDTSWSFKIDVIDVESEMAALGRYAAAGKKVKQDFAKDRKTDL